MKRLLVIRLSALGDVAIMQPVLSAWAEANPLVRFTVAAPPLLQPLFSGRANIDFLGVNKKQSAIAIYRQLRAVGADAVADLHQINRVGRAVGLLQLDALLHLRPLTIQRLHKGRLSRLLMLLHWRHKPRRPQHERYADVFRRLGLRPPTTPNAERRTPNAEHTIGLAPFAQHQAKIWPWENTCQLAAMLASAGYRVLLFGSKDEAPQLEALASQLAPSVTSLAGKHTFSEELDIIRNLPLMVSMDSANMHFASALRIPVVSIWGATHPDFGFYGYNQDRRNALCANLPCQPCSAYGQRPCRYGDHRCLSAITPQAVMDKIEKALHECRASIS